MVRGFFHCGTGEGLDVEVCPVCCGEVGALGVGGDFVEARFVVVVADEVGLGRWLY